MSGFMDLHALQFLDMYKYLNFAYQNLQTTLPA